MGYREMYRAVRSVVVVLVAAAVLAGCSDDSGSPPGPTATPTGPKIATATRTQTSAAATATSTRPVATPSSTAAPSATSAPATAVATSTATEPGATATPTPTPTNGSSSYEGDYNGTAAAYGTRFHVAADGSAEGFLDFLSGAAAGAGGAADISVSYPASGQANLETGAYELSGDFFGNAFTISGELPASAGEDGSLVINVFDMDNVGTLQRGSGPTPTPTAGCDTATLAGQISDTSGGFNGDASSFVVERMPVAGEQKAPDYIPGVHEVYNSTFNGTTCDGTRNIQILLFQAPGGLAAGQTFTVGATESLIANIYYGQTVGGEDAVWSSSAGTVSIESVEGSVVTMHVSGAAMTVPAGAAAGSFTLKVDGEVNNFTRQLD